jgi:glycosyltransferase involved in cell wall biosynthesis
MDPERGGVAEVVRTCVPALNALNCRNEVVCLDARKSAVEVSDEFPIHRLGKGKGAWSYQPLLATWLEQNLHRFEAVIIHGLWQYHSFAIWRAFQSLKKQKSFFTRPRLFIMPHGMLDPWFQRAPERRLKAIRNWIYWKLIEHRVIRDADGLLFTCEEEMRLARTTFCPYKPKAEYAVGYGIPEPENSRNASSLGANFFSKFPALNNRPFLLFMSRIHPKKGVDLLIKAYAEMAKVRKFEGEKVGEGLPILVIAGPCADPAYLKSLQDLASSLALDQSSPSSLPTFPPSHAPPSVVWLPMLTGDEKWGAFHACDAFILPSHQENFGIAVVEALACGKPVLISNQVNIWLEIEADGAGIVKDDSVAGTKELISAWVSLPKEKKEEMRLLARDCFRRHFEITRAAGRLFEVVSACE